MSANTHQLTYRLVTRRGFRQEQFNFDNYEGRVRIRKHQIKRYIGVHGSKSDVAKNHSTS